MRLQALVVVLWTKERRRFKELGLQVMSPLVPKVLMRNLGFQLFVLQVLMTGMRGMSHLMLEKS